LHRFDNTRKIMAKDTSEIAKLTERISKDPKSKLFVPLAEEYKKIGDIEMAIHVLSEGLKNNPGYVTARSFLGRLLLEQGDFAASQNEFEEVIKAIPDNLLAQRKLGDLYVLQNRQEEALKHYKIALALNPGDAEFASLISDAEAGVDVRARLLQPKSKVSPGQAIPPSPHPSKASGGTLPSSLSTPAPSIAQERASLSAPSGGTPDIVPVPGVREAEPERPVVQQSEESREISKPHLDAAQPHADILADHEEPEDILMVEPLDEDAPVQALDALDIDLFSEKNADAIAVVEPVTNAFELSPKTAFSEQPISAPGEEDRVFVPGAPAMTGEEPAPVLPAQEQPSEQSGTDDFTTDTLAELYIAQGFFEKAIDIYERMLADNPNSRGLKEKLERVKAMALPATEELSAPASVEKTAPGAVDEPIIFDESNEFAPAIESKEKEFTIDAELYVEPQEERAQVSGPADTTETDIFAEPREYRPPSEPEEWTPPAAGGTAADEIFMPPQEAVRPKPQYTDFEPREYIPPTAERRPAIEDPVHTAPKATPAARKETIDRLEQWLSNIKKEK
jgi:tetratricopeptide (TPR) repeat protein